MGISLVIWIKCRDRVWDTVPHLVGRMFIESVGRIVGESLADVGKTRRAMNMDLSV